jgi:hypothetical protein
MSDFDRFTKMRYVTKLQLLTEEKFVPRSHLKTLAVEADLKKEPYSLFDRNQVQLTKDSSREDLVYTDNIYSSSLTASRLVLFWISAH